MRRPLRRSACRKQKWRSWIKQIGRWLRRSWRNPLRSLHRRRGVTYRGLRQEKTEATIPRRPAQQWRHVASLNRPAQLALRRSASRSPELCVPYRDLQRTAVQRARGASVCQLPETRARTCLMLQNMGLQRRPLCDQCRVLRPAKTVGIALGTRIGRPQLRRRCGRSRVHRLMITVQCRLTRI